MNNTFVNNQRVRIKPCKSFPAIRSTRYGLVVGLNDVGGMHFVNEERISNKGEWAYLVASYHSPNAGALWFSEKGIEPMKRRHKS